MAVTGSTVGAVPGPPGSAPADGLAAARTAASGRRTYTPDVKLKPTGAAAGVAAGAVAMAAWAASGVMAKGIDLPGMTIIAYRMWMYSVVVVVWLALRGGRLTWQRLRLAAPAGWHSEWTWRCSSTRSRRPTIANATVIGALQPILMLLIVGRLFGERVHPRETCGSRWSPSPGSGS